MTSLVERLREYAGWRLRAHQSECTDPLWPKPTDIALAEDAVKEIGRLRNHIVRLQHELSELLLVSTDKATAWDALNASHQRGRRKAFEEALSLVSDDYGGFVPDTDFGVGYKRACENLAAAIRQRTEEKP
ncbi:hypothetical protein U8C36_06450 [Sinorhizobium medicae]|uniref:hypothetical protein n=1 Tax=Sinorhizobium medicae TaxID=110321 RepID=UPI0005A477A7|nr:hypothetical protein [Sinorhizobium medicae]WQO53251.1 hypothetical protein U8C36_06450 [Sinorhizobium medicae]WQO73948.1 hypothetical protein U8C31_06575 [Sinorhizobium medicae]